MKTLQDIKAEMENTNIPYPTREAKLITRDGRVVKFRKYDNRGNASYSIFSMGASESGTGRDQMLFGLEYSEFMAKIKRYINKQ